MFIVNRTSVSQVENINFYWLCCGGVFVGDIRGLSDRLLSCKRSFRNLILSMLMEFTKKKNKNVTEGERRRGGGEGQGGVQEKEEEKSESVCVSAYIAFL